MLELISHLRFRERAVPVDIGPYHNHGVAVGEIRSRPGITASATAIGFEEGGFVGIKPSAAREWNPLVALRIEVVVKMQDLDSGPMVLVEAGNVFSFRMVEWHLEALVAAAEGEGISFMTPRPVWHPSTPGPTWRTLTFDHDGYSRVELRVDDAVVGRKATSLPVLPASPVGITIGNHLGGTMPFSSAIDEVRIYRLYPRAIEDEFFCRPFSPGMGTCWAKIFQTLQAWAADHPDQFKRIRDILERLDRALNTALFQLPPDEQARVREILREYARLWCKGDIDGPAMHAVMARWIAVLRSPTIASATAPIEAELQEALAASNLDPKLFSLDCDPAAAGFLDQLHDAAGDSGKAAF